MSAEEKDLSRKPEDSDFQQQRLKAWQPLLTPKWVILTFALIGVIFIPIGAAILVASQGVVEVEARYDNLSVDPSCNQLTRSNCNVNISVTIPSDMKQPVYFYYKLTNYYQNHRRYVKSRSDAQLRGDAGGDTSPCDPLESTNVQINNSTNYVSKKYYPCGLIAGSIFNDTFAATLWRKDANTSLGGPWSSSNAPYWQKDGIAWSTDKSDKFKPITDPQALSSFTTTGIGGFPLYNVTDEDFMVWMRTAGLPTFKKLYRKINYDLNKGDVIQVTINNVYPVSSFSGQKAVVLSTTSWMGGKNDFLGYAYIVVGALCIVLAIVFFIKHKISPRPLGDMKYFNWPGNQPATANARQ